MNHFLPRPSALVSSFRQEKRKGVAMNTAQLHGSEKNRAKNLSCRLASFPLMRTLTFLLGQPEYELKILSREVVSNALGFPPVCLGLLRFGQSQPANQ